MPEVLVDGWLYREERMALRATCLLTLLQHFGSELNDEGSPQHSAQSIYECAHDWVSQGNPKPSGILKHFETYYALS